MSSIINKVLGNVEMCWMKIVLYSLVRPHYVMKTDCKGFTVESIVKTHKLYDFFIETNRNLINR